MKHLITLGLLISAAIMYAYGEQISSGILFCMGGISEAIFWTRMLDVRHDRQAIPESDSHQ